MRDVSEPPGQSIQNIVKYILQFIRHPIHEIAHLPPWSWKTSLGVQVIGAMISGFIAALIKPGFFRILAGLIVTPFIATIMVTVLTAFLYYYFQVFEKKTVSAQKIFTLTVLASLPFFFLQIGSTLLPPITLIGFAFSTMLIAVGLTENFQMEKRRAVRLAIALFAIVLLVWITDKVSSYRLDGAASSEAVSY